MVFGLCWEGFWGREQIRRDAKGRTQRTNGQKNMHSEICQMAFGAKYLIAFVAFRSTASS